MLRWLTQIKLRPGIWHIPGIRCGNDSRRWMFRTGDDFAAPVNGVIDESMADVGRPRPALRESAGRFGRTLVL